MLIGVRDGFLDLLVEIANLQSRRHLHAGSIEDRRQLPNESCFGFEHRSLVRVHVGKLRLDDALVHLEIGRAVDFEQVLVGDLGAECILLLNIQSSRGDSSIELFGLGNRIAGALHRVRQGPVLASSPS